MELLLNGEHQSLAEGGSVRDLLTSIKIDTDVVRGIAVAVNERIVRRNDWSNKILQPGDRVEVVTAQQGG